MFDSSVIRKTGQWWKLVASFCGVMLGGLGLFSGMKQMSSDASGRTLALMGGGILLMMAGLAFACTAIRCPRCHAHWLWAAVSKQDHNEWMAWLLSRPTCPQCSFPGEPVTRSTSGMAA